MERGTPRWRRVSERRRAWIGGPLKTGELKKTAFQETSDLLPLALDSEDAESENSGENGRYGNRPNQRPFPTLNVAWPCLTPVFPVCSVFWDLYCAAPDRRETCEHSSEAKAFHDYVS